MERKDGLYATYLAVAQLQCSFINSTYVGITKDYTKTKQMKIRAPFFLLKKSQCFARQEVRINREIKALSFCLEKCHHS
jgi:hypothetical protein